MKRHFYEKQPDAFSFTKESLALCQVWIKKYPQDRQASAIVPLLTIAQKQHGGWLPKAAIACVATMLEMPYIRALEVASFYSMFNFAPVGKYFVQLCGTTPCWLRGSDEIKAVCLKIIGPKNTVRHDGLFSWTEVECLGACVNAPMVQINDTMYEDLTPETFEALLENLEKGKPVHAGPQNGRTSSEPASSHNKPIKGETSRAKG